MIAYYIIIIILNNNINNNRCITHVIRIVETKGGGEKRMEGVKEKGLIYGRAGAPRGTRRVFTSNGDGRGEERVVCRYVWRRKRSEANKREGEEREDDVGDIRVAFVIIASLYYVTVYVRALELLYARV